MKKILFLFLLINFQMIYAQTWEIIPDTNFVKELHKILPGAMRHDSLDVSSPLIKSINSIQLCNNGISDLTGIQYFSSCTKLVCTSNPLIYLPALPDSLKLLYIHFCPLKKLPNLPNSLIQLMCYNDSLTELPDLPDSLTLLYCYQNKLSSLPNLPPFLRELNCGYNKLDSLPSLPSKLSHLYCNNNALTKLPYFPNSLKTIDFKYNLIQRLPLLPDSLEILNCSVNLITEIPKLPNTLKSFYCAHNLLKNLPDLPNTIVTFSCQSNSITDLPVLPDHLTIFWCDSNLIKCFPVFPNTIQRPYFVIKPNPFDCLPNYINGMNNDILLYPLCKQGNSNGCLATDDIKDIQSNHLDFLVFPNPASRFIKIKSSSNSKFTVELFCHVGIRVFTGNIDGETIIDLNDINDGIYILKINQGERVTTQKVIIAK